jgi:hypothetical protein
MEDFIAPCGDRCDAVRRKATPIIFPFGRPKGDACPRYTAKTPEELRGVAELLYRMGWRDTILPPEEIVCSGCTSEKTCEYGIVECQRTKEISKCKQCPDFPCPRINEMLETTRRFEKRCKEVCSAAEYAFLTEAFFEKEDNLRK